MNHLLRQHAPIGDIAWKVLDDEARTRATQAMAARRLVDFSGPHGWEYSAANIGRTTQLASTPLKGINAAQRRVAPVLELRADFEVRMAELLDIERGAQDADLGDLDRAAQQIAEAENTAVFHGWPGAIRGITESSPLDQFPLGDAPDGYAAVVAGAVEELRLGGVAGPYAVAVGPGHYRQVIETVESGALLLDHVQNILGGPVVRAPGVRGAVVLSTRGGDFLFDCGQDLSVGYTSHDSQVAQFYLEESFSLRVATPDAAVALTA